MLKFKSYISEKLLDEALEWHAKNDAPLVDSVFRVHSEGYYALFIHAKKLFLENKLEINNSFDLELMESDIGEFDMYDDNIVPLDAPFIEEEKEDVELNKPKRGGSKKFYVYVRDPQTKNIRKIEFGDTTGLSAKINNPEARKSFAARHQCELKKDKTSSGYWSCRLPYYAKSLGLSGGGSFFW
jgi:hypothetical protein